MKKLLLTVSALQAQARLHSLIQLDVNDPQLEDMREHLVQIQVNTDQKSFDFSEEMLKFVDQDQYIKESGEAGTPEENPQKIQYTINDQSLQQKASVKQKTTKATTTEIIEKTPEKKGQEKDDVQSIFGSTALFSQKTGLPIDYVKDKVNEQLAQIIKKQDQDREQLFIKLTQQLAKESSLQLQEQASELHKKQVAEKQKQINEIWQSFCKKPTSETWKKAQDLQSQLIALGEQPISLNANTSQIYKNSFKFPVMSTYEKTQEILQPLEVAEENLNLHSDISKFLKIFIQTADETRKELQKDSMWQMP